MVVVYLTMGIGLYGYEASKNFALHQTHCQLFGSKSVADAIQGIIDTNDGPRDARHQYFFQMIEAMKKDLNEA
mgnify:FL=1